MELFVLVISILIGILAAFFDTRTEKLIVEEKDNQLIETKSKKINFVGFFIIFLNLVVITLSIILKNNTDDLKQREEAQRKNLARDQLRSNHPIEPINIHYKIEVKLNKIPPYSSFHKLARCIVDSMPSNSDSIYIDSNAPFLKKCIPAYDYSQIFEPLIILSFCAKPEENYDITKALMFLSDFTNSAMGNGTNDLKLEITYYPKIEKFKIYYIAQSNYNLRKGFIKDVISLIDLPMNYVVCTGFNADAVLNEIIIESGSTKDRTVFNKLNLDVPTNSYYHKIDSTEISYSYPF